MLLLRSNGTLLHMKDCIITFVKLIISKKHNFILYNALTNRDSPNFPLPSNPLPQIVTSNPRLQTDTYFAVDIFHIRKPSFFRSLASNPNFRKSPEIRRFLALDFIFLTSRLPSQHALRRLNCSLFYSLVCENMSNVSSVCGNISMDYSFSIVCFWYS